MPSSSPGFQEARKLPPVTRSPLVPSMCPPAHARAATVSRHASKLLNVKILSGAEGQNRTGDTVIFSHVLYQLSYLGTGGHQVERPKSRILPWRPAKVQIGTRVRGTRYAGRYPSLKLRADKSRRRTFSAAFRPRRDTADSCHAYRRSTSAAGRPRYRKDGAERPPGTCVLRTAYLRTDWRGPCGAFQRRKPSRVITSAPLTSSWIGCQPRAGTPVGV